MMRDDGVYIEDIIQSIQIIDEHIDGKTEHQTNILLIIN
jgi:uncharacterized protein with HEPN domain